MVVVVVKLLRLPLNNCGWGFYIVNEDGLCFMAVAKADFQTRICFAFLARVVNEYNPGARYKATMAQHMDYFR